MCIMTTETVFPTKNEARLGAKLRNIGQSAMLGGADVWFGVANFQFSTETSHV